MLSSDALTPAPKPRFGLSSSTLKIIACVTMLIDHVGAYLVSPARFPLLYIILRIIGRIAFPIFAFCIAQGCRYTRNRGKRFLLVFGLGVICELAFWLYSGQLEGNILLTFSCSILVIYIVQTIKLSMVQRDYVYLLAAVISFGAILLGCYKLPTFIPVDYGFWGILLPVFATLPDYKEGEAPTFFRYLDHHWVRLLLFGVGLFLHWWQRGMSDTQAYAFLALMPLALYNGKPGRRGWKYGFYVFYPAHLLLIFLVGLLLTRFVYT